MKQKDQSYLCVCRMLRGLSESIRRILRPLSIAVFFKPPSWKWTVMKGVKDERKSHEKAGVVYEMRCNTYIGETARSANIRGKEHHAHARNGHPELSAVAEHAWTGNDIERTPSVIASCKTNRERKVTEAWLIHDRERKGNMTTNRD